MEDNFIRFDRDENGNVIRVVEKLVEDKIPTDEASLQAEYDSKKAPRDDLVNKYNQLIDQRDSFVSNHEKELEEKNNLIEEVESQIDEKDQELKIYEEFLGIEEVEDLEENKEQEE